MHVTIEICHGQNRDPFVYASQLDPQIEALQRLAKTASMSDSMRLHDTTSILQGIKRALSADAPAANREDALRRILRDVVPIVDAAYLDEHSAACIPGSGYSNKAQHLAGVKWGFMDGSAYRAWRSEVERLL